MARPIVVLLAVLVAVVGVYSVVRSVRAGTVTHDLLEYALPTVLAMGAARIVMLPPPSRWVSVLPLAAAIALVVALATPGGIFRVLVNFAGGFVIFWWLDRRGRYLATEERENLEEGSP